MAVQQERIDRSFVPGIDRPAEAVAPRGRRIGRAGQVLFVAVLLFFSVLFTYPMLWLLAASFKDGAEVFSGSLLPSRLQLENYSRLLEMAPNFGSWFFNSVIVSGL